MTDNQTIEWGAPPPWRPGGGKLGEGRTQQFVKALRERPGEWAKYPATFASAGIAAYRKNFPQVEWTARKNSEGRHDMYGRWIGDQS